MKIVMFMLFFVCNMFTVLIIRFAYESNYRYNNGMLIGVTFQATMLTMTMSPGL